MTLERHYQHALLRLAEQYLVWSHPRFANRDAARIDRDSDVAARGHLGGRRCQAGGTHVLNRDDVSAPNQLETRLEQQLLGERIAHLNSWAFGFAGFGQIFGRERRAVNSVASGARADAENGITDSLGFRTDQLVLAQHSDAHCVDQRIAIVSRVENDLACDGWHSDAIAVVANSLDDAGEQVSVARAIERAESQRVEHRDRARAHREYVAKDSADTGCGALIGLDRGRMVV